jgi:hypothetical protein
MITLGSLILGHVGVTVTSAPHFVALFFFLLAGL